MPTNRELATLFWLAVILAVVVSRPGGRAGLRQIIGVFFARTILIVMFLFLGWVVLVVAAASAVGLWNVDLAKDTMIWLVTIGLPILLQTSDATTPGFFRRKLITTVKLDVIVGFYLNLVVFPLIVELALQPLIAFAMLASGLRQEDPAVKRMGDRLRAIIGLGFLAGAIWWSVENIRSLDLGAVGLDFLLPLWLLVSVLPLIYVLSVAFFYETALLRLRWSTDDHRAPWKAKLALVLGFRLNLRDLSAPGVGYAWKLARVKSVREGLTVVGDYKRSLRQGEADERRAEERLVEYAGVPGADEEGHQLDQREFEGTKSALDWIAVCQMGWYRNGGRYRADILKVLNNDFSRQHLPAEHGIQVFVSRSGRGWYAWRRTIAGWCFAIGATKAPPDQWRYDGPEPPVGFPGKDPTWGTSPFDQTINWE